MFQRASEVKHQDSLAVWFKGAADTGKTVAALDFIRKFGPGLVIPSDMRIEQYQALDKESGATAYVLATDSEEGNRQLWQDEDAILKMVREGLPKSDVSALVWDSPTPGFRREILRGQEIADFIDNWPYDPQDRYKQKLKVALREKFNGYGNTNKVGAYQFKATFMAKVSSLADYGLPIMWINHEVEGVDSKGDDIVKPLITDNELGKFLRNLNLRLRSYVNERGQYCIAIDWARGRPELTGKVYVDKPGNMWVGIWDQIEADFFAAEVVDFWDRATFDDDDEAIALAIEIEAPNSPHEGGGIFKEQNHARNAFSQVKEATLAEIGESVVMKQLRKSNVESWKLKSREMLAEAWKNDLRRRLGEIFEGKSEEEEDAINADDLPTVDDVYGAGEAGSVEQ